MIDAPPPPRRTPFKPADSGPCLCGSGQSFRSCCASHLPGIDIGNKAVDADHRGDWATALTAARADVTQYSLWHLTHTAPLLRDDPQPDDPRLRHLLDIDIGALDQYVQTMWHYYERGGSRADIPAILEHLRANIDHDRWRRRIVYLRCLHALGAEWDQDAGREEFERLGSMADETDVEILQLYLDLYGRDIGLADQLAYAERIARLSTDQGQKLHYRCLKATALLMAGDAGGAERELMSAIGLFRTHAPKDGSSLHGRRHLAGALCLAGILGSDTSLLDEAQNELQELLALPAWTPDGQADLLRQRGDIHRHKTEWEDAKATYREAMDLQPNAIHQVFLAQCILFVDSAAEAAAAINEVAVVELNPDEYVDYVLVLAHIAIESGDMELLKSAECLLRETQVSTPYFSKKCDALLILIIDTRRIGPTVDANSGVRHLLSDSLFRLTRYVKLEPNLFGFGLNLGKMIDDANERYLKPTVPLPGTD